jgi:hypothetical protein
LLPSDYSFHQRFGTSGKEILAIAKASGQGLISFLLVPLKADFRKLYLG